jgi:hypothetical protein
VSLTGHEFEKGWRSGGAGGNDSSGSDRNVTGLTARLAINEHGYPVFLERIDGK